MAATTAPGYQHGITLIARVRDGIDAGRDVCRLHPEIVSALAVRAWEPVMLQTMPPQAGARAAALVGYSDWESPRQECVIDSFCAGNLGVPSGGHLVVTPVITVPAEAIWVSPDDQLAGLPVDVLRSSLLGKAVVAGERETLLPQDYNRPFTHDAATDLEDVRTALGPNFRSRQITIARTQPQGVVLIGAATQVHWEGLVGPSRGPDTAVSVRDLGGLDTQVTQLAEILDLTFHRTELLRQLGATACHGVLLQGPVGSGKAELTYAVAAMFGATVVRICAIDLEFATPDTVAKQLRDAFATQNAGNPVVVLIQDIDRLAPANPDEKRATGPLLLRSLDAARDRADLIVVATTIDPQRCDPALFSLGRLDRRIDLPVPDAKGRLSILSIHTRPIPLAADVDLAEIAQKTPGFVGADLARLCLQAAMNAAGRLRTQAGQPEQPGQPGSEHLGNVVTASDFAASLAVVHPSALGTDRVDVGDVTWADIGNAELTKKALAEAVTWPIRYPDTFARLGLEPPRGVLLYGPPGCGKTFVVRALANESDANLVSVKGAELLSKWVGESEAGVREIFRRARAAAPAIVFIDEIDALAPTRGGSTDSGVTDRVVAQLLTELDGVEPIRGVAVVGATNRPDLVDPALLRPGRLERHVFVEPPDAAARVQILAATARKMPVGPDVDLAAVALTANGYSAADLAALAREAGFTAMRRDAEAAKITAADFTAAAAVISPSLDPAMIDEMRRFSMGR